MSAVSLARQISALNAEIGRRRQETEREIRAGRMTASQRDFVMESLEAGLDTLQWLHRIEPVVKQRLFNNDAPPAGGCW